MTTTQLILIVLCSIISVVAIVSFDKFLENKSWRNLFKKKVAKKNVRKRVLFPNKATLQLRKLERRKNETIKSYTDLGVNSDKIFFSEMPCTAWSITRRCLVGGKGLQALELINDGFGNYSLSYQNNRLVSVQTRFRRDVDVAEINKKGIIVTYSSFYKHTGERLFRYDYVPS